MRRPGRGGGPLDRRRVYALALCLGLGGMAGQALPTKAQPLQRYAFSHGQMGTEFHLVLYAPDSSLARRAADAAWRRIDTLNQHLSDYLSDSELSRLSATAGSGRAVPVSDDLWNVLHAAQRLARQTNGAFDVTVGPLTRLWRRAMRRNGLPEADRLAKARQAVGYRHLHLDSTAQSVRLTRPGMWLDLGGIAKGFAGDAALDVLRSFGITAALVDGGGDLVAGDPPPGARGWRVALSVVTDDGPLAQEQRLLARAAVATSGDTYRFVEVDGIRYSHLLDPRTGMGLTDQRLVTVAAPTGMEADALASALSILGPAESLAFVADRPAVGLRYIQRADAAHRQVQSPAFDALLRTPEDDGLDRRDGY